MRFICKQSDLSEAISLVSRVVPSRPSHPVLANILFQANQATGIVSLTGFDLSIGVQASFECVVSELGSLCLPAKLLGDIVSRLSGELVIESSEENGAVVTIMADSGEYQIRAMDAAEFPELPEAEGETVEIDSKVLNQILIATIPSASTDETKQVLTGVRFSSVLNTLEGAATNGHVLSVYSSAVEGLAEFNATIPVKTLRELPRMLDRDSIRIAYNESQMVFETDNHKVTTRLIEGQYPDYQRLIPKQFSRNAVADRKVLIGAVERMAVLADQKNSLALFTLNSDQIVLTVEAADVGSGRELIPATVSTDEPFSICFNVRYILEGLKAMNSAEVRLECNGATNPAVISPVGSESKHVFLVMPVQQRS